MNRQQSGSRRCSRLIPPTATGIVLALLLVVLTPAAAEPAAQALAGQAAGVRTSTVITIGVGADLSGPAQSLGWGEANSVQLAADNINTAGGISIGGITYTLVVVTADSQCDPGQGAAAANALLAAGAVAVVGHTCSGDTNSAQPVYAAAGVPMITPSATNPAVTQQGYTTTFRTISHDGTPPAMLARYWYELAGHTEAAIVAGPNAGGTGTGEVFSYTFTTLGGTITSLRVVTSTAQYTATLTAIMGESPDVIVFDDYDPAAAGQFSAVAYGLGMTGVPIGWTTHDADVALQGAYASAAGPAAAEGDFAAMYYRYPGYMPGFPPFLAAYQAAGFAHEPNNPGLGGPFAYDAARIIIAAMLRANSVDPAAIRNEIAATNKQPGVVGLYQGFDAQGDVRPQWAWVDQNVNGSWVVVAPSTIYLGYMSRNAGP